MPFDVGAAWSDPSWTSSDKFGVGGGFTPKGGWPDYTGSIGSGSNIDWGKATDTAWGTKSSYNVDKSSFKDGLDITLQHLKNFANSRGLLGDSGSGKFGAMDGFSGGVQQINNDLSAVYPQQHGPTYIPGQPGQKGFGGALGGVLGTVAGLALAPLTGGASLGLTAAESAGIGGAIGGGIGSMFG